MVRSLYSAASGMMAQQTNVDVIANNLANVNTIGYKSQSAEFKSLLYQDLQAKTTSANGENKPVSAQVGLGSRISSITSHYTQGSANATDGTTDFLINGMGFFAIENIDGNVYYTRNGNFFLSVDTDGTVLNFAMNDKCAAGTGRFFESMARAFEMSLDDFSKLSLSAKNVIPITAQCAVFAESEVISLVGEGKPMDEIAAGIELSVAKRCFVMAKKAGVVDSVTLTGGCAKNEGLKQAIEKVLKVKVVELPVDPQLMGALGAAEYARQKGRVKQ